MTQKTYRFVGFSTLNGKTAVRYANSKGRVAVLRRNGHEGVFLRDAGETLAQTDLVDLLLDMVDAHQFVAEPEAVAAIEDEARRLGFAI